MSTTFYVGLKGSAISFKANELSVDIGYFKVHQFFEELEIQGWSNANGTVGEYDIKQFRDKLENYTNPSFCYHEYVIRMLKLIRLGINEGADLIYWA